MVGLKEIKRVKEVFSDTISKIQIIAILSEHG
uniref:Uncharacterized protein n=1 Tax=Rhizophora mucronata TaxID=61149 RepID=A0A2P2LIV5_RHIMU